MRRTALLVTGLALALAGCASATDGTGTPGSGGPPSSAAPSGPAGSASTAPPPSPTGFPSTSEAPAGCDSSADYCDDFSSAGSGWPVDNEAHYYANYADYLAGTYRVGERTANAKTQLAPFDTTTISKDYGVRVEADAVLGEAAPAASFLGLVCWDHDTSGGAEAGFLFFVTRDSVDVTLLSDAGGQPHTLARNGAGPFIEPFPATNHLTATCTQRRAAGGIRAVLRLEINDEQVLAKTYAKSVKNYSWSPGPSAGVLVAGKKSDVFYDNFSITAV